MKFLLGQIVILFLLSTIRCDEPEPLDPQDPVNTKSINNTAVDSDHKVVNDDPSELNDNPKLVNDTLVVIQEDEVSYSYVRKVLYVIAPVSALFLIYFLMKGLRNHSRFFLSRYNPVSQHGDSLEMAPLGALDSDEEDETLFDRG